jgi:hypothetical protein
MSEEPAVRRYLAVVGKPTLAEHFARFGETPLEGFEQRLAWARDLHFSGVKQAEALLLHRDVALIREALRREVAPRRRRGPVGQARGLSQLVGVDELVGGEQPELELTDLAMLSEDGETIELPPRPVVAAVVEAAPAAPVAAKGRGAVISPLSMRVELVAADPSIPGWVPWAVGAAVAIGVTGVVLVVMG